MRYGSKGPGNGEILEGRYANYFEIGHNAFEFLLDFGQLYFEAPEASLHTRIVTSPVYAKRLFGVLQRALSQYEASYGRVLDDAEAENAAADGREATGRARALKIM
jgi:hypothetical protein